MYPAAVKKCYSKNFSQTAFKQRPAHSNLPGILQIRILRNLAGKGLIVAIDLFQKQKRSLTI
jgi:hypothetical protein